MSNGNGEGGAVDEDGLEIIPEVEAGKESTVNWEERAKKFEARAAKQREKTAELKGKLKERADADARAAEEKKGKEGKEGEAKPGELDRVDRAVLRTEKITDAKEIELVQSWMKDTGKTVEQLLESKHFLTELKELRELNASEDATPEGKNRSGGSARNTVEYWIAKDELPPVNQPELRQKVVNAKMAQKKAVNQFTNNPVL